MSANGISPSAGRMWFFSERRISARADQAALHHIALQVLGGDLSERLRRSDLGWTDAGLDLGDDIAAPAPCASSMQITVASPMLRQTCLPSGVASDHLPPFVVVRTRTHRPGVCGSLTV